MASSIVIDFLVSTSDSLEPQRVPRALGSRLLRAVQIVTYPSIEDTIALAKGHVSLAARTIGPKGQLAASQLLWSLPDSLRNSSRGLL
jgi:hypothetical protein